MPRDYRPTIHGEGFTLRLPDDQRQALARIAETRRVSVAVIIRDAIDHLIERQRAAAPPDAR